MEVVVIDSLLELSLKPESHLPVKPVGSFSSHEVFSSLEGLLSALLFRSDTMAAEVRVELESRGFVLPSCGFRVAMYVINESGLEDLDDELRHNCRLNLYLKFRDELAARLQNGGSGFIFSAMGCMLCIWFESKESQILRSASDFAIKSFGFLAHCSISHHCESLNQAEIALRIINQIEQNRVFYSIENLPVIEACDNQLLRFEDSSDRVRLEQTFLQAADQICGAIASANQAQAALYMRNELSAIAHNCKDLLNMDTLRFSTLSFWDTLRFRLVESDVAEWKYLTTTDFSRLLMRAKTMEEYCQNGEIIIGSLMEHRNERVNQQNDLLMRRIYDYVIETATDSEAGLGMLTKEFLFSPRDIAIKFRSYYGYSVKDLMHKTRVAKAKELLISTDKTVTQVAEETGYYSLATMYRAFIKYEGVAPGQVRNKNDDQD